MGNGPAVMAGMLMSCAAAAASEIGQQVAGQISASTYRHYLDCMLYTHNFDNRGADSWLGPGPQHDPARDNILTVFQRLGLSVELQGIDAEGQYYNVVATQTGTVYPDSYYVVRAHYDSWGNPGADDDASGVAGLLEIARVLSFYQTEYTIKYIAFDLEEWGLVGSDAYVQEHLADDIRGMVALDMIAHDWGTFACDIYGRTQSDPVKLALGDALATYASEVAVSVNGAWGGSDHASFEEAGFQACLLIEDWGNSCYHWDCDSVDTPDYISYDFAADLVRATAGFLADQAVAHPLFDCATGAGCELGVHGDEDCNGNAVWDGCDIACGSSGDCNGNHIPDECEPDCNANGVPDDCEPWVFWVEDFEGGLPSGWFATGLWHITAECPRGNTCDQTHWAYYGQDSTCDFNVGTTAGVLTAPPIQLPTGAGSIILSYCSAYGGEGGSSPVGYDAAWVTVNGELVDDASGAGEQLTWQTRTADLTEFAGGTIVLEWHFDSLDYASNTGLGWQVDFVQVTVSAPADCNGNDVPDFCDIARGASADCQPNSVPDECELANGTSTDCNNNGILDDCEPGYDLDCNSNGVADFCDLATGTSQDCNGNGIPDECELESSILFPFDSNPGWSAWGQWAFGQPTGGGSHNHDPVAGHTGSFVYGYNLNGDYTNNASVAYLTSPAIDCTGLSQVELRFWRWLGVQAAPYDHASVRVSNNGHSWVVVWENGGEDIADSFWWWQGFDISAIADGQPSVYIQWGLGPTDATVTFPGWNIDDVEIHGSQDCNHNNVPDRCESQDDCNGNGKPDICDLSDGTSTDVNSNGIPDECESVGDLNCDGVTDFGDINPFVLYLSNFGLWQATFPGCDPLNGDINGDGVYGQASFGDINPFVALLTGK
jgi:hypothetical protein